MMNAKLSLHGSQKRAHQADSNETPQLICEFQVNFHLLRIRTNQDKPYSTVKGSQLETHIQVVGYRLNRLDEPVLMAVPKHMQTEFGIHHRLESCGPFSWQGQNLCGLSLAFIIDWRVVCPIKVRGFH